MGASFSSCTCNSISGNISSSSMTTMLSMCLRSSRSVRCATSLLSICDFNRVPHHVIFEMLPARSDQSTPLLPRPVAIAPPLLVMTVLVILCAFSAAGAAADVLIHWESRKLLRGKSHIWQARHQLLPPITVCKAHCPQQLLNACPSLCPHVSVPVADPSAHVFLHWESRKLQRGGGSLLRQAKHTLSQSDSR